MTRPLLRRAEVPEYVKENHGVIIASATLSKWASIGGGPPMRYFGRIPMYAPDDLDTYVREKLSAPVRSTAERNAA